MNGAGEGERLPPSIGGLIGFALRGWAANAPLYLALQLGVFAAYSLAETVVPAAVASSPQGQFKEWVLLFTGLFADALVIAAVAMGIAARSAGAVASPRALVGVAIDRWLPVIAVSLLAQAVVLATAISSGFGPPSEPRVLQLITAPFVWIVWGILGLTGPFVALAPNRRPFSVIAGFVHAFTTSLRRANVLRLAVLAVITVLPAVLQQIAFHTLVAGHVSRPIFWSEAPIDVLTIGPLAAVQTAFALDFARRAGDQRSA
ncbi:MAG TPA: hypothetical protein VGC72_16025 [Candidatus Elarobacter sp.]